MPKSKKNKIVHLTQVKKKGKDHKEDLLKQLEQYVAQFKNVYIFDFEQAKSDRIMNLRIKLKSIGRIFSGKNSLISVTLRTVGTRTNTDYEELIKQVAGYKGLLFTDLKCNKLLELLDKEAPEFCKKLIGYSQIAPNTVPMLVDDELGDDDNSGPVESAPKRAGKVKTDKKNKMKKNKKQQQQHLQQEQIEGIKKSNINEKREVKFVRI